MSGFPTADKIALMENVVKQNRPRLLSDEVAVNAFIPRDRTFNHHLRTSTFFPVFTPTWNTTVYLKSKTDTTFTIGLTVEPLVKHTISYRLTTVGGSLSVSASARTATLTHNLGDATVPLFFCPMWPTNVWVTSKSANSMDLAFSTAPSSASQVLYGQFDLSSSDVRGDVSVTASAVSHLHTHSLNAPMADLFVTPTWNTVVYPYDPARLPDSAVLRFSTAAPSGKTIDVAAGIPLNAELL